MSGPDFFPLLSATHPYLALKSSGLYWPNLTLPLSIFTSVWTFWPIEIYEIVRIFWSAVKK